jgi:hypothetical protein
VISVSASGDPDDILDSTRDLLEGGGIRNLLRTLLGGTFVVAAFEFWGVIQSLGSTFLRPLSALASGLANIIESTFLGPTQITGAGADTAARALTDGLTAQFGVLAFPIAVAASMAAIYVFAIAWQRIDLSPLAFLRNLRS